MSFRRLSGTRHWYSIVWDRKQKWGAIYLPAMRLQLLRDVTSGLLSSFTGIINKP
jgi:hypothetical protein